MENVEVVGFHEHHGRHHRSTRYWEAQMKDFAKEMGKVCRALDGFQPQEIDIGGGLARSPETLSTRSPITRNRHNWPPPDRVLKALNLLGSQNRYKVLSRLIDTLESRPNQK